MFHLSGASLYLHRSVPCRAACSCLQCKPLRRLLRVTVLVASISLTRANVLRCSAPVSSATVISRRPCLYGLPLLALTAQEKARAEAESTARPLATAVFSGGDPRLLQPAFDEIRYLGVKSTTVGSLATVDGEQPALLVSYDADKLTYKRLVGAFWRAVDPTKTAEQGQFGTKGPTIVWVASADEKAVALESRQRLERSGLFKGAALTTIVADRSDAEFLPAGIEDQRWYATNPEAYRKLLQSSGRAKWFEETYKPIKTTACEGSVCGFVYFPCSEDNGCLAVLQGTW